MSARVLQTPSDLRREDVAGDAHDKQFAQARIKNPLGRHTRIAATQDRRVGSLGVGEFGHSLPPECLASCLAAAKSTVPFDQPRERLIRGGPSVISKL